VIFLQEILIGKFFQGAVYGIQLIRAYARDGKMGSTVQLNQFLTLLQVGTGN
jgi:hypothetical protein